MNRRLMIRVTAAALAILLVATNHGEEDTSPYKLASQPVPTITGAQIVTNLETFVTDYPNRTTGGLDDLLASQWLSSRAASFGYTTAVVDLPLAGALPGTGPIRAVTAFKEGTDLKDEVMLFIGHYDTLPQSLQGAYDNGSGTTMLLALAESFKDVPTRRSIMFAWYNGEEEGVLASSRHVTKLKADGVDLAAVFGFDMVGISYPVATPGSNSCLCMWHGSDDTMLGDVMKTVNHQFLAFPKGPFGGVQVVGNNNRNSDERSFEDAGAATMRWAGLKTAAAYPQYHMPQDTMATIYTVAGGRSFFEQGMRNTLLSAYYTALAVDTLDDTGSKF